MSKKSNLRVLIVDDEKILADCMQGYLQAHDFDVQVAYTARQAIMILEKNIFDVVFCDICLPQISGVTILKTLRTRRPLTEVIMMTGYTSQEIAKECLSLGAYDFLFKPFRLDIILDSLNSIAGRIKRWEEIGITTKG